MPEISVAIGGRTFEVACQEGEEHFLRTAAKLLDTEASEITKQIGRMPETRMLLMAGLMLADKAAGIEEELRGAVEKLATQEGLISEMNQSPRAEPKRVEVPVIPAAVTENLAEVAARLEALADQVEERSAATS